MGHRAQNCVLFAYIVRGIMHSDTGGDSVSIRIPPIIEGHDGGSCFWIQPVKCHSKECFGWDAVEKCSAVEISLDEGDVSGFFKYFFYQSFDRNLVYNQQRKADWCGVEGKCEPAQFEWYLTHNFYTQKSIRLMLADISNVADKLEQRRSDSIPSQIIENYRAWLIDEGIQQNVASEDHLPFSHLSVMIDFDRRFVSRMEKMLDENPAWPLISMMGP